MAAGRVAKIQLTADTQELVKKVQESKKVLESLNDIRISPGREALRDSTLEMMGKHAEELKSKIKEVEEGLEEMGKKGGEAFDVNKVGSFTSALGRLKNELKSVTSAMGGISDGGGVVGGDGGRRGGGGLGSIIGSIKDNPILKAIGISAGIGTLFALYRRQLGVANEGIPLKALSGEFQEGDIAGASSRYFTSQERRQRGREVLMGAGGAMKGRQLRDLIDVGEKAEMAYQVTGETQGMAMGAGRKAGGGLNFFANVLRDAVQGGLEGARVSEFLSAISQGVGQLSQDGLVDTTYVSNLARGLVSGSNFYGRDPQRAMTTAGRLNQAFTSGDRFQQAMSYRSIATAAGGAISPAAAQLRRGMGLFYSDSASEIGGGDEFGGGKTLGERLSGLGVGGAGLAKALGTSGKDILGAGFKESMMATGGQPLGVQAMDFMSRMGLKGQGGLEIFTKLKEAMNQGKDISSVMDEGMVKTFSQATKDWDQRVAEASEGSYAEMKLLNKKIQGVLDLASAGLGETASPINMLAEQIGDFLPSVDSVMNISEMMSDYGKDFLNSATQFKDAVTEFADTVSKMFPENAKPFSEAEGFAESFNWLKQMFRGAPMLNAPSNMHLNYNIGKPRD